MEAVVDASDAMQLRTTNDPDNDCTVWSQSHAVDLKYPRPTWR